jgi:hypothetical protein
MNKRPVQFSRLARNLILRARAGAQLLVKLTAVKSYSILPYMVDFPQTLSNKGRCYKLLHLAEIAAM